MSNMIDGLLLLMDFKILLIITIGLLYGTITAAIPGFSSTLALAVAVPLTFSLDPLSAMVFLTATYSGGCFGGSIPAILLNIPGSPDAIVTSLDGYPMTLKGKGDEALGIAVFSSSIGNLIGSLFLILIMPIIVLFALKFGPPELFLVSLLGLMIVATLHESFLKASIAGSFGVLIGTIGMTPNGIIRGTWGHAELMDGIPIIPALIGLIGFSELFYLLQKKYITDKVETKTESNNKLKPISSLANIFKGYKIALKYPFVVLRSSVIGILIGALPGAGSTIASMVSYNEGKRFSKNSDEFGKGSVEGIISAETANNASEGGALATMLSLGIPGGTGTAILIGALMLQGLVPGPRLFADNQVLVYGIMFSQFLSSLLLLFVGVVISYYAIKVIRVPTSILIPVISVLSIIGTFAMAKLMFDVKLMLIFGALGIILKKYDFPILAVILGIILSPIIDAEYARTYQIAGNDISIFFTRPISLILVIIIILTILPLLFNLYKKIRKLM